MEKVVDKELQEIKETFENLAAQVDSVFNAKISEDKK